MKNLQSEPDRQSEDRPLDKGVLILGFRPESTTEKGGMKKGDVIVKYGGIGDLTTESLTALAAATNPKGTNTRVVFLRDHREYSVELPPGPLGISAMDSTMHVPLEVRTAQDKTRRTVRAIRSVYFCV
jgi:S1-C subfamily serine protease